MLASMAHIGYGGALGAPFGLAPRRNESVLSGMLFGSGVWFASYLGWLPALKLRAAATRQPARRNWIVFASHLVWGALLASLSRAFTDRGVPMQGRGDSSEPPASRPLERPAHQSKAEWMRERQLDPEAGD